MGNGAQDRIGHLRGLFVQVFDQRVQRAGQMRDAAEAGNAGKTGQGGNGSFQIVQQSDLIGGAFAFDQRADAVAQFGLDLRGALEKFLPDFKMKAGVAGIAPFRKRRAGSDRIRFFGQRSGGWQTGPQPRPEHPPQPPVWSVSAPPAGQRMGRVGV